MTSTEAPPTTHVVVMGVSGCGKTVLASLLAGRLGFRFCEADDVHPAANVEKMSQGIPLTDEDRWPWLRSLGAWVAEQAAKPNWHGDPMLKLAAERAATRNGN